MRVRPVVGLVAGQRRLRAPHSPPTGGCGQGGGGGPVATQRAAPRLSSVGRARPWLVHWADVAPTAPRGGLAGSTAEPAVGAGKTPDHSHMIARVLAITQCIGLCPRRPLSAQAPVSPKGRACQQGRKRGKLGLWPVAAWLGGDVTLSEAACPGRVAAGASLPVL